MSYDLYVITDQKLSRGLTHDQIAEKAVMGGADAIQLRDKHCSGKELMSYALKIREITRRHGALFFVNDRLDIAIASEADGVHLGQDDMPLSMARKISPPGFIIGISAGTVEEAIEAEKGGADYVGAGPVYGTLSKSDAGPACGICLIEDIKKRVSIPVVAIGGINENNVGEVLKAGADGVAAISAVISQEDVAGAAAKLKSTITAHKLQSKRL